MPSDSLRLDRLLPPPSRSGARRGSRSFRPAVLAAILALGTAAEAGGARLRLLGDPPRAGHRVEIAVEAPEGGELPAGNPFDPDSVAVDAEIAAPGGARLHIPGFWYQEHVRRLEGGREVLEARGKPGWRVRFTPRAAGTHRVEVAVRAAGREVARAGREIEVAPGGGLRFARVEPRSRRYFALEDGTPLFLIGTCCCWHGKRGTYDYDDWLAAYQKAGVNYVRIWMWPHAFGIEWDRGDRLHYRLDRAWTLDRVLAEAERRGIYVMLCLDYHGMLEVKKDYWGGNDFWPRHPYNAAAGGPCQRPNDFFRSKEARALYRKRLRYLVARYSAFPSLLAWQLFNEIDNVWRLLEEEDVVDWHADMARYLHGLDPYRHPITTSLTSRSERPAFWKLEGLDFAQYHSYNEKHPAAVTASVARRFHERYRKPVFIGEYGTDFRGWKPKQDPFFRALRQAVWSGAASGAAGTAMSWWWESTHAAGRHEIWGSLARFVRGTGLGGKEWAPIEARSVGRELLVQAVGHRSAAIAWCLDPAYDWPEGGTVAEPEPFRGGAIALSGLEDGMYRVTWWDTKKGAPLSKGSAEARSGTLRLEAPPFRVDVAARAQRADH